MLSLRKLAYGSISNVLRLLLSILVATTLPPLLVRHLPQAEYSAWVLILQLSAYVTVFDLGLQTIIAKLVAEYHAKEDAETNRLLLSTSVSFLMMLALVGLATAGTMVWKVPELFRQMPTSLIPEVRLSLLLIGCTAALGLPFGAFPAVFTGLQEYGFPTAVALLSRLSSTLLLIAMVLLGKGLLAMSIALTAINLLTSLAQWVGWQRLAKPRVGFSPFTVDLSLVKVLFRSGGVYAVWTLGFLLVSGVDLLVIGHYDFRNTGFYSVAATASNFMLSCVVAVLSPLLPAVSEMQTREDSKRIGQITIQSTRFCGLLLCALSVPLLLGAYPLLSLWVGQHYAMNSVAALQILVVAGIVRTLGFPYGTIVIATGQQHLATLSVASEALTNLGVSIWLVQRFGAIGVAYGTLAGAFVGSMLHLAVSMKLTQTAIKMSRKRFLLMGMLRPVICTLPMILLLPVLHWNRPALPNIPACIACTAFTWCLLFTFGLTKEDRSSVYARLPNLLKPSHSNT